VSLYRKLFIAAALVGVGLGVALLLGEPRAVRQVFEAAEAVGHSLSPRGPAEIAAPSPWASSSIRLVPERESTAERPAVNALEAPPLAAHLEPVKAASAHNAGIVPTQAMFPTNHPSTVSPHVDQPAQARLRNEAPRPLGVEPRSAAQIQRAPPVENATAAQVGPHTDGAQASFMSSAPNVSASGATLVPVGFAGAADAQLNPGVEGPKSGAENRLVPPSPWPLNEERAEPRMHVVVDGDSLEKLAGRYLGDPQRGREIFELNREVLADPNLLPLGVELKIPERSLAAARIGAGFNNGFSSGATVREAASGNLVPVRSAPNDDAIIPRAQLARPVAAE
jgi:nucleoid-associated protein YgaU